MNYDFLNNIPVFTLYKKKDIPYYWSDDRAGKSGWYYNNKDSYPVGPFINRLEAEQHQEIHETENVIYTSSIEPEMEPWPETEPWPEIDKDKLKTELLSEALNEIKNLKELNKELINELDILTKKINTPGIDDFFESVKNEAAYQRETRGAKSDAGKTDSDWFWLIGYLAGKVFKPNQDTDKILHHIIAVAAVCLNWHNNRTGVSTEMRPGIEPNKYEP